MLVKKRGEMIPKDLRFVAVPEEVKDFFQGPCRRRMGRYGLGQLSVSEITDKDLDNILEEMTREFPSCGGNA